MSTAQSDPLHPRSYRDVQSVLEQRCVVCHGCYDAPCQLKLSSYEGLTRGANPELVYNGYRITNMAPTRLLIDAQSTAQWRKQDFHTVLNESGARDPEENLSNSVLYQMLRLKQLNPQPRSGILPDSFTLELGREQICSTRAQFDDYARKYPLWGMPYAMPNLSNREHATVVQWLAQGAPPPKPATPSSKALPQIKRWEVFLNGTGNRHRLVSRYIYEHLFFAHLHFEGTATREFYRIVRSHTPPDEPVDEIATVRPNDDPGRSPFYYRLRLYHPSIVAKDHIVYSLSDQRMQRFRNLFLKPEYEVAKLPGYTEGEAINPIQTFAAIPQKSRYRFLLDDARFFIEGFVKGPVCRGQIALNVIEDQFWVFFADPDADVFVNDPKFLDRVADDLELPAIDNRPLGAIVRWHEYWSKHARYHRNRIGEFMARHGPLIDINDAVKAIWDGDGQNPNAALTIFRHFDSASVMHGLHGDYPETAWVIEYPQLERIHYLLVANYDVYGHVGHQLTTRLYMDFLRMEGENNFLVFLPVKFRKILHHQWYVGIRERLKEKFATWGDDDWISVPVTGGFRSDDPQRELYQRLQQRISKASVVDDFINRCRDESCVDSKRRAVPGRADRAMQQLARFKGPILVHFPDVTFVRIKTPEPDADLAYTVIHNKAYKNVSSIFADEEDQDLRDLDNDSLTVIPGLEGSYPNYFWIVDLNEVEQLTEQAARIRNRKDYEKFAARFGIRRTNPSFWSEADWFHEEAARRQPLHAGIFDLNRYLNR